MSEQQFALDKLYYSIMTPIEKISVGRCYMTYREVVDTLNEQQATINKQKKRINELEQRDYDNQSERYKILGRAIELSANYIEDNDLEYFDFCGLVTEFENELLEGLNE